jgi:hypothetical protein
MSGREVKTANFENGRKTNNLCGNPKGIDLRYLREKPNILGQTPLLLGPPT